MIRILAVRVPALALLWLGLVIGISFIATPVKFQAETLTLPAALDVGRHTFAASHVAQLILAGLLAAGLRASPRRMQLVVGGAIAILVAQQLLVLPVLEARAAAVIRGESPPASLTHVVYVVLEIIKAACLAAAALATRR